MARESAYGAASMQTSRLAPRRHSFVLGRGFVNPIACGFSGVSTDGHAWYVDPASRPARPRPRPRLRAGRTQLATVRADRGANRRFGDRPPDRANPPPSVSCPGDLLRLARAPRAIAVKAALVSIGHPNSCPSGPNGRRLVCLRGGRHPPRPVERNHEQARMIERVDRSACEGQNTHRLARAPPTARPTLAARPRRGMSSISASMSQSSR
jgi:hypothetical protein